MNDDLATRETLTESAAQDIEELTRKATGVPPRPITHESAEAHLNDAVKRWAEAQMYGQPILTDDQKGEA